MRAMHLDDTDFIAIHLSTCFTKTYIIKVTWKNGAIAQGGHYSIINKRQARSTLNLVTLIGHKFGGRNIISGDIFSKKEHHFWR